MTVNIPVNATVLALTWVVEACIALSYLLYQLWMWYQEDKTHKAWKKIEDELFKQANEMGVFDSSKPKYNDREAVQLMAVSAGLGLVLGISSTVQVVRFLKRRKEKKDARRV